MTNFRAPRLEEYIRNSCGYRPDRRRSRRKAGTLGESEPMPVPGQRLHKRGKP